MNFKNQYTIPDLLTNESFLNFYFQKNENDVLDWEEWQEDDAERTALVKNAFQLLDKLSLKWDETEIKKQFSELENRISTDSLVEMTEEKEPNLRVSYRWWMAAAASFLLVLTVGLGYYVKNKTAERFAIENSDPNKSTIYTLTDGSTVTLKGKSKLSIAPDFNQTNRTVFLTGEAFFDVAKNADKPFLIYTGDIVTKVLGTSFTIKSPFIDENTEGGKKVEVEVVTGKVSVFKKDNTTKKGQLAENGVVITPNQKVTYLIEDEHFVTGIVDKPILLKEVAKQPELVVFKFEETPLSVVLKKLETAYGISILLSNDKMNDCTMSVDLTKQPLLGKLDLICAILKAHYEVKGTNILISGRGCE